MKKNRLLHRLIRKGSGKSSLVFAMGGLGIGVLVLLLAVQGYLDIGALLHTGDASSGLSDVLVIHKEIPEDRISHSDFTPSEFAGIREQPFVEAAGPVTSNQFKVSATAGLHVQFYTDLFFEAVPDTFLEKRPPEWQWNPGDRVLPMILASDYLTMYNYGFALSQGLPQLSESAVEAIPINLTISGPGGSEELVAHVVGFSDRISSILVPQSFLDWANTRYGLAASPAPSGIILRVKDPSNPDLTAYLSAHHYRTNAEKLKYSKIRVVIATVLSAIGLFGLGVIILALVIFSVYLQLIISRSREDIRLLSILGYEAKTIGRVITSGMLPLYFVMVIIGLMLTEVLQVIISNFLQVRNLPATPFLSPYLLLESAVVLLAFYLFTRSSVNRNIKIISQD